LAPGKLSERERRQPFGISVPWARVWANVLTARGFHRRTGLRRDFNAVAEMSQEGQKQPRLLRWQFTFLPHRV
jgi:hypothetical protein